MKQIEEDLDTVANSNPTIAPPKDAILIDASRDGGVWWFPQVTPFNADEPHQGTALANYLKGMGYKVEELGGGKTITMEILQRFKYVIRAVGDGSYTSAEMQAYMQFLKGNNALLLFNDHLKNFPNDQLSDFLGLKFEGAYDGPVYTVNNHPITAGVTHVNYIVGSVIVKPDPDKVTVLGYCSYANIKNAAAMGILNHPSCRIFFIGDMNGLEQLPQPFTDNLINWLFQK